VQINTEVFYLALRQRPAAQGIVLLHFSLDEVDAFYQLRSSRLNAMRLQPTGQCGLKYRSGANPCGATKRCLGTRPLHISDAPAFVAIDHMLKQY
jgi:hypothetical protein